MTSLKIATYNIHKGFSQFNRRMVLHELREQMHALNADILFLQEVQGAHTRHVLRHHDYPDRAQYEFIADEVWPHHAYGKNSVYRYGHHGNAVLSRFPIVGMHNRDVSAHRFESRGLLHCELDVAGKSVHCLCVHFGLFSRGRSMQTRALIDYVREEIPDAAPLIIAGDFNDWRNALGTPLANELDVHDVFHTRSGKPARSFPARLPLLTLDRIYVRGFRVLHSDVHCGETWARMSDHAALSAQLGPL